LRTRSPGHPVDMDHSRAPVLEALRRYHADGSVPFNAPGHKQGRGIDPRVLEAAGRIAAEMITPYPPGAPAVLPGEVINQAVLDYLRSGVAAGMFIPDAVDGEVKSVRVVAN
jgi:arginine/lysine/ornithine decarboxylase